MWSGSARRTTPTERGGPSLAAGTARTWSSSSVRSWPRKPLGAPLRPRSPDPLANYPDWQRNGLTALVKAGVINSPDYWANKFGEAIKVGEIIGILGKMMEQPTE